PSAPGGKNQELARARAGGIAMSELRLRRRILGIDLGQARIGVAVSDELGLLAHPVETIPANKNAAQRIAELVREKNAERVIVGYDGSPVSGWQSQSNRNGIQDHVEKAFAQICGEDVRVHGAGRTDAGVHALAQCAHVDLPAPRYGADRWRSALNGVLPAAIR